MELLVQDVLKQRMIMVFQLLKSQPSEYDI
jgi:hypothetical protein